MQGDYSQKYQVGSSHHIPLVKNHYVESKTSETKSCLLCIKIRNVTAYAVKQV